MIDSIDDETPFDFEANITSSDRNKSVVSPENWMLFYHMVRNMKTRQLTGIAERKFRHVVVPRLPVDFDARYERRVPSTLSPETESIERNLSTLRQCLSDAERDRFKRLISEAADGRYTFLGRTITFDDEIDWDHEKLDEYPLLWRLKLQAFEHFEWVVLAQEYSSTATEIHSTFARQPLSWAVTNPIGEKRYLRRSWIPHSVSLRILNWCRYSAWRGESEPVPDELYQEIYKNALFLGNHVEYDIGGNHLVENAIALIMAGVLFENHDTGWTETGLKILEHVGETQFLADGGHFERSPMYHVMVLRRYVTAYDLLSETDLSTAMLQKTAERALGFLAEISKPDGKIPLLNDAAYGEQLESSTCLDYAASCRLTPKTSRLNHHAGSGYRRITTDVATLLVDVGDVGPPHIPAHSHNDHLSVLLWIDGVQVLTDTGVYDYGPNERRQYARSVEAHNTVQYGDAEPIRIGGRYLMGKRASVEVLDFGPEKVEARYARNTAIGASYEHRRNVTVTPPKVRIVDRIRANGTEAVTVRFHLHPSIDVRIDGPDRFVARRSGEELVRFTFSNVDESRIVPSPYFERFGRERERSTIEVMSSTGTEISTILNWSKRS